MSAGNPLRTLGQSPVLDGRTPVFLEVGADPTVAPGIQLPPGSVVVDGSTYYLKTGVAATAWTLLSAIGGGGSVSVTAPITGDGTGGNPLAMAAATAGNAGHMTAAQAALVASALQGVTSLAPVSGAGTVASPLSIPADIEATLRKEALIDLELTSAPDRMLWLWHPFYAVGENGLTPLVTGTTSGTGTTQGWFVAASAANAKRLLVPGGGSGSGSPHMFVAGTGKKFWMAALMLHQSGNVQAGDSSGIGALGSGDGVTPGTVLGIDRSTSTTNFSFRGNSGIAMVSTIAFNDSLHHKVKAWRSTNAAGSFLKVDGETPVGGTARPSTGMPLVGWANIGASGTQSVRLAWAAFATEIDF
jgi:hypothetical protein